MKKLYLALIAAALVAGCDGEGNPISSVTIPAPNIIVTDPIVPDGETPDMSTPVPDLTDPAPVTPGPKVCVDSEPFGDGYGWDGTHTCLLEGFTAPPAPVDPPEAPVVPPVVVEPPQEPTEPPVVVEPPIEPEPEPEPVDPPKTVFIPEGGVHYSCGDQDLVFSSGTQVSDGNGSALATYDIDNSVLSFNYSGSTYQYLIEGFNLTLSEIDGEALLGDNNCSYQSGEILQVEVIQSSNGYLCSAYTNANDTWLWVFDSYSGRVYDENYNYTGYWHKMADGTFALSPDLFDVVRITQGQDGNLTLAPHDAGDDWGYCQKNEYGQLPDVKYTMQCGTTYYQLGNNSYNSLTYSMKSETTPDEHFNNGERLGDNVNQVRSGSVRWDFEGGHVNVYGPNPDTYYIYDVLVNSSSEDGCTLLAQ